MTQNFASTTSKAAVTSSGMNSWELAAAEIIVNDIARVFQDPDRSEHLKTFFNVQNLGLFNDSVNGTAAFVTYVLEQVAPDFTLNVIVTTGADPQRPHGRDARIEVFRKTTPAS